MRNAFAGSVYDVMELASSERRELTRILQQGERPGRGRDARTSD